MAIQSRTVVSLLGWIVLAVGAATAYQTRGSWLAWLRPTTTSAAGDAHHDDHADEHADRVELSAAARANLRLVVAPVKTQVFWKTIAVPGEIRDRPGVTDRAVASPTAGVVKTIHARTGDTVRPGDRLFDVRVVSEGVQAAQAELFKSTRELALLTEQKARLEQARGSAIPESRFIELDLQISRVRTSVQASRQDLQTRGFNSAQIDSAAAGEFISEVSVVAPPITGAEAAFELQELKVSIGESVVAGAPLCILSDHRELLIEGHGFRSDAAVLARATTEGWPITIEPVGDDTAIWTTPLPRPTIRYLANAIDPQGRTLAVMLPLTNQLRAYPRDGRTLYLWRFRPGQPVRLQIPTEKWDGVIVLPIDAIVREIGEVYAFRANGDLFEKKSVVLLHADSSWAVLQNDGSLPVGTMFAQNAAHAINRVIKAKAAGGGGGHHHDHDH